MEGMELRHESLRLYFTEVKDSQQNNIEFESELLVLDESEQATDFLQKAGLSHLSKLYYQGKEISDAIVNDSVRQRHLTEKQAQTIRSRVRTLNKTLRNRQPRRKQRQDIRDVTWNLETSSTGSRSRSATPDSLDSITALNEELTSDEEQPNSLTSIALENGVMLKGKLKWTSSEPIPSKVFSRHDRGDVAHLGSENVVLKGYHPLNEYTLNNRTQRERSGSDPSTDIHIKTLSNNNNNSTSNHNRSENIISDYNIINSSDQTTAHTKTNDSEAISFEGLVKTNEDLPKDFHSEVTNENVVNVDSLSDSEYQYLKPLLWVEVTAIFDHYKISILKRKASNKHKRGNVFGVNLTTLVMRDFSKLVPTDSSMVPQVYQSILSHLNDRCIKEDGILRVAGQKQKLEAMCNEIELKFYNNRLQVENIFAEATVHDLTGILKKLLRELPDPVFTMELFDMFYKCSKITSFPDKIRALNILVLMLPVEHRNTFKLLLNFFNNIIKHEQNNRMGLHNVAMITAPSLFPPKLLGSKTLKEEKVLNKEQLLKEINDAAVCCNIMEVLLQSGDSLWMIPAELVAQAQDAQRRAHDRKELGKEKKSQTKKKLQRSSTQYEPGAMLNPRIKRDFII